MPITAKQTKNANWDFDVAAGAIAPRQTVRQGSHLRQRANRHRRGAWNYSTDRYGIVQNDDLVGRAEDAFASRGIKLRAQRVRHRQRGQDAGCVRPHGRPVPNQGSPSGRHHGLSPDRPKLV